MKKHEQETTKTVGIWIRVSTEDQVRGESPEHHERRCRLYAESKGWTVEEVYRLDAMSGKSVMAYPETQRMLGHLRSGRITGLIFSKLARLARNTKELLDFAEIFRSADADLISLQESIDTSTPAGRLFYTMIAAMAQWEREEIAERVAASVPIRAKMGKPLGGAAPFGYQWVDRELVPNPKEAPIRKLMYEMFLEHRRVKTVVRLLNHGGHRTRDGALFTATTVKRLLLDPTAKGVRRANYTRKPVDGKKELKPESEWVLSQVPAIISSEIWEQCHALIQERRNGWRPPAKKPVQLFAGFVLCDCGGKMYVPSNTPKYVCRACRRKIPQTDLEAVFQEQLRNFVFSPEDVAAYLEQADYRIKEKRELLDTLERERKTVSDEMQMVYRLYVTKQISAEGFGRQYTPLEERLKGLENEIPHLQAEVDYLKIQHLSSDEIFAEARDLYSRWDSLEKEQKHKIIETITDKIVISKDEIEIKLAYLPTPRMPPPSPPEMMAKGARNALLAVPFCHLTLKAKHPALGYPKQLKHLGDHIRRHRIDLHLTQKQVGHQLGVRGDTVRLWERGVPPIARHVAGIVAFLGYDPLPKGSLAEQIRSARLRLGLSYLALGQQLGISKDRARRWEQGITKPDTRRATRLCAFLRNLSDGDPPPLVTEGRAGNVTDPEGRPRGAVWEPARTRRGTYMVKVAAYHTNSQEYLPTHREVHHDHDDCSDGKRIQLRHRESGTGGKPRCKECIRLG